MREGAEGEEISSPRRDNECRLIAAEINQSAGKRQRPVEFDGILGLIDRALKSNSGSLLGEGGGGGSVPRRYD